MSPASVEYKNGDVLLFHGTSFVSWAIRVIDGTEVNHVAIVMPDGTLAEAGGMGLQSRPIPTPGSGEYFLVHRLNAAADLDPVTAKAKEFLDNGHFYAYQQIVLLAVLGLTRKLKLPWVARRLVRSALDHAAGALMDLLPAGSQWMICSEYVYRAYDEAVDGPPDPYEIQIAGLSFAAAGGDTLLDWAIANAHDVPVAAPVAFGPPTGPTEQRQKILAIEADLAPLIDDYARALLEAGEIDEADLPPVLDPSFGPAADLGQEPTDEEMLASATTFASALLRARSQPDPAASVSFGAAGATIGAAAAKGALEGLRDIAVNPDFVTPGDLLASPSFSHVGRVG
jgi:hypothetical protein